MSNPYNDIIHLSRPQSSRHLPMSMRDRAAQFSPFAALTGYDAAIEETARLTDQQTELADSRKEILDQKIRAIQEILDVMPEVCVTFFEPDLRKSGGSYQRIAGRVKKIDNYEKAIIFEDGTAVYFWQLHEIECAALKENLI